MLNRIAVICPSRERANRIGEAVDAFYHNSMGHADLFVAVDESDPQLEAYGPAMNGKGVLLVGPDARCCPKLNQTWNLIKEYRVVGFQGDDCLFRTPNWDGILLQRVEEGGTGIYYPRDAHHDERHTTHYFFTNNIPKTLGYFAHPGLIHLWVDTMTCELGKESGLLRYMPDILLEHMHYSVGKAVEDARYAVANNRESWDVGERIFNDWKQNGGLQEDVRKLKELASR